LSAGVLAVTVTTTDIWMMVAICVLLLIAIGTAVAETAIVRITRPKASALSDEGRSGSSPLLELVESPERWINSLLLVALLCQLVQATLTGIVVGRIFDNSPLAIAIATALNVNTQSVPR